MKRIAISGFLFIAALANAASFTDYATVRSVVPQYDRVSTPRKECSTEVVTETRRVGDQRSYGGAVIGGIAGALLGNRVGGGHGKEAATAAGAVIGALAGDNIDNRDRVVREEEVPREIQRCRTVDDWQERVTGYRVTYEYQGQRYTTILPNDPGHRLPVRVSVDPVAQ
ncbi:glycine zipper 2TM domain-containing protein [Chitinimonas sp.]|uniref:glycine zipper 2TM domain-containing protein n=1 Tax=Chitinimonas sp. TaxID=1934313 RepID=UPI0035B16F91